VGQAPLESVCSYQYRLDSFSLRTTARDTRGRRIQTETPPTSGMGSPLSSTKDASFKGDDLYFYIHVLVGLYTCTCIYLYVYILACKNGRQSMDILRRIRGDLNGRNRWGIGIPVRTGQPMLSTHIHKDDPFPPYVSRCFFPLPRFWLHPSASVVTRILTHVFRRHFGLRRRFPRAGRSSIPASVTSSSSAFTTRSNV
jgi:hypothetical protein